VSSGEEADPIDENAASAFSKSCYQNIDWKIDYKDNVSNAVKRMTAGRIGCLGVTKDGNVVGVISERDYLNKIALLEKDPNTVKVEQICTFGEANLVKVRMNDNIDKCMEKMLGRDIRHLLVMENKADGSDGSIVGMISIKDVVKCTLAKANAKVDRLEVIVQTQDMMRHQI
jgi:signal-transduction protein with cAMP-binding, CBS, and nucleotidyltransferase domain